MLLISRIREKQLRKNVVSQAVSGEHVAIRHYELMRGLAVTEDEITALNEDIDTETRHIRMMTQVAAQLGVSAIHADDDPYWNRVDVYFDQCVANGDLDSCYIVQDIILESFAICLYEAILPGLKEQSRKIVETIIRDERSHLDAGVEWLKQRREGRLEEVSAKVDAANSSVVPVLSEWVAPNVCATACAVCGKVGGGCAKNDLASIAMPVDEVQASFAELYGHSLRQAGFSSGQVVRWLAHAI